MSRSSVLAETDDSYPSDFAEEKPIQPSARHLAWFFDGGASTSASGWRNDQGGASSTSLSYTGCWLGKGGGPSH